MRYREFGKTGKKLSVFGFGGSRFRNGKTVEENAELVAYAHEKGVNHFDSCPGYTGSEEVFSQALRGCRRDTYMMSTKNQPFFTESGEQAKDAIKRSLEKMRLDHFDFYYLWNVKRMDEYRKAVRLSGHYEALLEAKSEGLISHIALSSHLTGAESAEIVDDSRIEGILLNLNILNFRYTIEAARRAHEKGVGVGIMSPLYGGQIPRNEEKLSFLRSGGLSPTGAALRFAAELYCADYAYVAFRTPEEVDEACRIADLGGEISEEELEHIGQAVGQGVERACTGCMYCMPYCPQELPIAEYMTYYNQKALFSMGQEEFEKRLNFAEQWFMLAKRRADAADCIRCGRCEQQCTQHINIIERLAEFAAIEKRIAAEKAAGAMR